MTEQTAESVERVLRDELVRGDAMIATARPILRHLLANDDHALFSDEMIARVRGMMTRRRRAAAVRPGRRRRSARPRRLCRRAAGRAGAGAVRGHRVPRPRPCADARGAADRAAAGAQRHRPGALAAGPGAGRGEGRRHGRRWRWPCSPRRRASAAPAADGAAARRAARRPVPPGAAAAARAGRRGRRAGGRDAERQLRDDYDEGAGRLGLIDPAGHGHGPEGARARWRSTTPGWRSSSTALAMASGQERDLVVLSFAERQFARLALALRAAGLKQQAVEEQFLYLHPDVALPDGFDDAARRPRRGAARRVAAGGGASEPMAGQRPLHGPGEDRRARLADRGRRAARRPAAAQRRRAARR